MSNRDPNEICEKCRHFENKHGITECRKYAPRRSENESKSKRSWADVSEKDWCSEFGAK